MASSILVTPQEIVGVHADVLALAQDLRAGVDATNCDVQSLLAHGWSGSAARSFDEAWQQWRIGAAHVLDALDETAALLLAGAQTYDQQETRTRVAFAAAAR